MGTSTDPELTLVPDEIVGRWIRIEESDASEPKRPMGYAAGHIINTELIQPGRGLLDAPSMNVNVPVRVLGLGKFPATVEENVTLAFRVDGFRFDARVVVGINPRSPSDCLPVQANSTEFSGIGALIAIVRAGLRSTIGRKSFLLDTRPQF